MTVHEWQMRTGGISH